jgi:hypothetical protein
VREVWTGRVGQVAAKYGEHAPIATGCCNTCRTCVTTNFVSLAAAAAAGAGAGIVRFARRSAGASQR